MPTTLRSPQEDLAFALTCAPDAELHELVECGRAVGYESAGRTGFSVLVCVDEPLPAAAGREPLGEGWLQLSGANLHLIGVGFDDGPSPRPWPAVPITPGFYRARLHSLVRFDARAALVDEVGEGDVARYDRLNLWLGAGLVGVVFVVPPVLMAALGLWEVGPGGAILARGLLVACILGFAILWVYRRLRVGHVASLAATLQEASPPDCALHLERVESPPTLAGFYVPGDA